jgi:hypothetical protein
MAMGAWALAALAPPAAAFTDRAPTYTATVTAAEFDAVVSPTPSVDRRGQNLWIRWDAVTISSGAPVTYVVTRRGSGSASETVCTLTDPDPVAGNSLECRDFKPGSGVSYTMQALVLGPDTEVTWTLPPSSPVPA